jgi:hypothetical protein
MNLDHSFKLLQKAIDAILINEYEIKKSIQPDSYSAKKWRRLAVTRIRQAMKDLQHQHEELEKFHDEARNMDEWTWEGYDIYLERTAYTPEEFRKVMAEHDARRPKLTSKPEEGNKSCGK